jgi:hypothetical protein
MKLAQVAAQVSKAMYHVDYKGVYMQEKDLKFVLDIDMLIFYHGYAIIYGGAYNYENDSAMGTLSRRDYPAGPNQSPVQRCF